MKLFVCVWKRFFILEKHMQIYVYRIAHIHTNTLQYVNNVDSFFPPHLSTFSSSSSCSTTRHLIFKNVFDKIALNLIF